MKTLILVVILVSSCSGYRFRRSKNPFASYGIAKVSMPIFINRTPLAQVTGPFTANFVRLLSSFPDLELLQGENAKADALLLGILSSEDDPRNVFAPRSRQFVAAEDVGTRRRFLLPSQTELIMNLRLVLIKDPNLFDKKILSSKIGEYIESHPRVVFDRTFKLSQIFTRSNLGKGSNGVDAGGIVNFTNNKGNEKVMISLAAEQAVKEFKELVLYAF